MNYGQVFQAVDDWRLFLFVVLFNKDSNVWVGGSLRFPLCWLSKVWFHFHWLQSGQGAFPSFSYKISYQHRVFICIVFKQFFEVIFRRIARNLLFTAKSLFGFRTTFRCWFLVSWWLLGHWSLQMSPICLLLHFLPLVEHFRCV